MSKKALYTVSVVIYLIVFGCVTLPFSTRLIDRVEPHILGLPCFQFFIIATPLIMAVWLIIWFLLECKIEDKQQEAKNISGEVSE